MGDHNQINDIPLNAEKILFAEDLANCLLEAFWFGSSEIKDFCRANPYRQFVYNGFNEIMKAAVMHISESQYMLAYNEFLGMQRTNTANEDCFAAFITHLKRNLFSEGFEAEGFIYYSVQVVILAGILLHNGVNNAPEIAIDMIIQTFPLEMCTETWNTINIVAERLAKVENNFPKQLTPGHSSSDNLSSSESDDGRNRNGNENIPE